MNYKSKKKQVKLRQISLGYYVWLGLIFFVLGDVPLFAENWPTYMHDNYRSGTTAEELNIKNINPAWVYNSPEPVRTAWSGPAPWDPVHRMGQIPALRDFDSALFVTVVDNLLYFGSSVTDSIHCLDIISGKEKWFYRTNAPVRFPPSYHNGNLYFGSDDGYVYRIDAKTGSDANGWKYCPFSDDRLICNNSNLIPQWPIRTGTAVYDDKVYFASSLVTWTDSYLCSVNISDGSPVYSVSGGTTPMGAILVSSSKIYLTMGRGYPRVFNRSDGSYLGWFQPSASVDPLADRGGHGGSYALLTSESGFVYGRGATWRKGGQQLKEHNAENRDYIATETDAVCMVVSGGVSYILQEKYLKAVNRSDGSTAWSVSCDCPLSLIKAGGLLLVGGDGKISAHSTANGDKVWTTAVSGRVHGLAVSNGYLFASTDNGNIYAFGYSE